MTAPSGGLPPGHRPSPTALTIARGEEEDGMAGNHLTRVNPK